MNTVLGKRSFEGFIGERVGETNLLHLDRRYFVSCAHSSVYGQSKSSLRHGWIESSDDRRPPETAYGEVGNMLANGAWTPGVVEKIIPKGNTKYDGRSRVDSTQIVLEYQQGVSFARLLL